MEKRKIKFAENLKKLRMSRSLSRAKFAEMLSYSAKSVEKWEAGDSVPPLNVICDISALFGVSLEKLVYENEMPVKYFLGIDGGGTKTAFLLADSKGNAVSECKLGPSNPCDVGIKECKRILSMGIEIVCHGIPLEAVSVYAGMSGVVEGEVADGLREYLREMNFWRVDVGNDIENVLELTLGGQNGVAVICGTGVNAFAQMDGKRKSVAGHGYLFDNGGSGFDIGKDAFEAVFREMDGRGEKTVLTKLIGSEFDKPLESSLDKIYSGGKRYIASFASVVFKAYNMGDKVAKEIINRNGKALAEIILTALSLFEGRNVTVTVCGGICNHSDIILPIIKREIPDVNIEFITKPSVLGAVSKAKGLKNEQNGL